MKRLLQVGLLLVMSFVAQGEELEFTEFGTRVTFRGEDFSLAGDARYFHEEGVGLERSFKWRGACFITTPTLNLPGAGHFYLGVEHKTSWHGFLESPEQTFDEELFTLKVSYTVDGVTEIEKVYVSLTDLPVLRKLRENPHPEPDYYRGETQEIIYLAGSNIIEVPNATQITVSICNVGPGTRPIINGIVVDTDLTLD